MKYSKIAGIDEDLSQIALGTWGLSSSWGEVREENCAAVVDAALGLGINVIDTAPMYGYGSVETLLGRILKGRRDKVFLATKCGLIWEGKRVKICLKPESILKEIDDSLKRLATDRVDLYQCHWPDPDTPLQETLECLWRLRDQGKIRYIGVSNFSLDLLTDAVRLNPEDGVVTLQSPLSLLDRALTDEILPFCDKKQIGVLAYGPLGGGILSGKYEQPKEFNRDDARSFFYKFYRGAPFEKVRRFLDQISTLGNPLSQLAVNWVRRQSGVACVLAGGRTPQQVRDNAAATDWDVSDTEAAFIEAAWQESGL